MGGHVSGFNYIFTTLFYLFVCASMCLLSLSSIWMLGVELRTAGSFTYWSSSPSLPMSVCSLCLHPDCQPPGSLLHNSFFPLKHHSNGIYQPTWGVLVVLGPTRNHIELISKQDHCFRFGVWEEANFSESWCTLTQPSRGGACEASRLQCVWSEDPVIFWFILIYTL